MAVIELVINPVAGKGRALRIGEEAAALLKSRGIDFAKHLTDHPRHATELAREAAGRGAETVIAFGGDGTLTETAAGLRHTRTALGVVPAGTGNDFIKTIGTPREWREALEFILTHPARPVNSGMMNDRFFLNVGGAGFDVMVLDFANAARKRLSGIGSYLYGVLRAISAFRPIPMHVEIGGNVVLDGHYMICSVGNGRFIGGGIPITPKADVTDGLFDIQLVDAVPRWKIPFYLPSLMMGTLFKHPPAHNYRASSCTLSSPGMRLQLDGEILPVEHTHFVCESDALLMHW